MPRVAIICDYREEGWPSMDAVGDMLFHHLEPLPVNANRVCPRMPRRLSPWTSKLWNADRLLARFWDYPRVLRRTRSRYDVYHIVDHSYAHLVHELPAERTVITCHDLDTFECLLASGPKRRSVAFRAMTRRILDGFRRAARIVCVSRATRDAIGRLGLVDPARLLVVENGVDPVFSSEPDPTADAQAEQWLGPVRENRPELLHVGSTAPRKRLDALLRIFAAVRKNHPGARLIRVGGFTGAHRSLIEDLSLSGAVVTLPFLPVSVLAAVYRRASLLLLPSEAEGFGLPLVEALATGTSVVASDLPVLREVGGAAATYCPIGDNARWANAVRKQLEAVNEPERQRSIRQANLSQARRYCWRRNAQAMAGVYGDLFQTQHA
jgi:glycosyltransferase involved in cell wall biosynthesis